MREIKGKVWDDKTKKFHEVTFNNVLLSTNITDKNGVEIFVGDIIFDPNNWWGAGEVIFLQGRVGPCEGGNVMEYVIRNKSGIHYNLWDGKRVEVIGTMKENSSLIDEEYGVRDPLAGLSSVEEKEKFKDTVNKFYEKTIELLDK